ncbi:GAF and ANTAR domain-containing protein [Streptomyces sp. NPDC003077]|uniref:GAF and ANTAR domain-containing protein n=1 Tax=Streptomyces sp. NPDC003077 TaxID=3154443 RepID=UPI0033A07318
MSSVQTDPDHGDDFLHGGGYRRASEDRMNEQAEVARELTATMRGVPPEQVPARLCAACPRLLPVSGASISVVSGGDVRITLCATDNVAAELAELQYTLGEGPCLQAGALAAPVFAPDLLGGPDPQRWPMFARQAVQKGVEAVFSMPLGTATTALGTLDLYSTKTGALSAAKVRTALMIADAVTLVVLGMNHDQPVGPDETARWLETAEAGHEEVHQAVGMVMVQLDLSAEDALARIRARAFALGRTATEIARDIIDRRIAFHDSDSGLGTGD